MNNLWLAVALIVVSGCASSRVSSIEPAESETVPEDSTFVRIAEGIARASSDIATIWPGYWSKDQAFVVVDAVGSGAVVAIVPRGPLPEYEAASAEPDLRGRVYLRADGLPGSESGDLPSETLPIGPFRGYAQYVVVAPGVDGSVPNQADLVVHESFHVFQREGGFAVVDSIYGIVPTDFLTDTTFASDSSYRLAVSRENAMLDQIARTPDLRSVSALLREYLAAREARLRDRPDLTRVERHYEQTEGTAEYVGCRTRGAVGGAALTVPCITSEFVDGAIDNYGGRGGGPLGYLTRWRLYDSGAVLSDALERLGVPDWRQRVANGESLDVVASETVRP